MSYPNESEYNRFLQKNVGKQKQFFLTVFSLFSEQIIFNYIIDILEEMSAFGFFIDGVYDMMEPAI
jgi:hypothetical protein